MAGKELLKQYNSLLEEIKDLKREIKKLEDTEPKHEIDSVRGSNPYFPYQPRNFTLEGYNIVEEEERNCKILKKKDILVKRKNKCEELKIQIEQFISNIPDSLTRRVFKYRYIENLPWLQIAYRIGKHDESYPRKVVHDKYLENLGK
ncbi:hypothetical protein [Anaerosalibacter massiliensis]|uniref:Uncharacterized protein n=1 Tax=Anaerosalibacter massiliensis TaxID=1347392 RepID=A0A9X2MKQ1_9FIRM|nr:hypothetical protein [Anaerosalibacter massiliensis]MCR2045504.1 hypothetical protein [Anaerosalibacter massiliensis]